LSAGAPSAAPPPLGRVRGLPWAALGAISAWGVSFVAVRVALEAFTPVGLVASRLALGAPVLWAVLLARRRPLLPAREDRARCVLLGAILATHLGLQAYGLRRTSAVHAGWIVALIPVAIAATAHLLRQERLRPIGWAGVALALGAVLALVLERVPSFAGSRAGDALQLASCGTWTAYTLLGRRPVSRSGALRVTALAMGVAVPPLAVLTLLLGATVAAPTPGALGSLLFLGWVSSGAAFTLWYVSQERIGSQRTAAVHYLQPLVTSVAAALLLAEPLTARVFVAGPAVLLGVHLVTRGARSSRQPRPEGAALSSR